MSTTARPNLLLVFSDQHRWCDLGAYGNAEVPTPNLDAFAAGGIVFDRAYSNCPLCVPARGTILTGLHALKHGAIANDLPIRTDVESIADVLGRAGYRTGYVGKWHLGGIPRDQAISPDRRLGFDAWKVRQCSHDYLHPQYHDEAGVLHTCEGYEPVTQTDLALDFLRENAEQAWGLVLSWGPPHDPYDAVPEEYRARFDPAQLTLRPNVPEEIEHVPGNIKDRALMREWLAGYYAHMAALDEQFGRLVAELKRTGQWENTLVVYFSDHGDMLGSQGRTLKQLPYEESAHIPLIVGGGAVNGGRRSGELISLADLAPTVLGHLSLAFENETDGEDLSDCLVDPQATGPDQVYLYNPVPCHHGETRRDLPWRAIRTRDYLYALDAATGEHWLLFDMEADPLQQRNLIGTMEGADLAERLRDQLRILVRRHDHMTGAAELLQREELVEEWNRSQRFFNKPELG